MEGLSADKVIGEQSQQLSANKFAKFRQERTMSECTPSALLFRLCGSNFPAPTVRSVSAIQRQRRRFTHTGFQIIGKSANVRWTSSAQSLVVCVVCRSHTARVQRCGSTVSRIQSRFINPVNVAEAICYAFRMAAPVGTSVIEQAFGGGLLAASQRVPSIQHFTFLKCVPMGSRRKSCSI